jgi:hypothetical protein
MEYKNLKDCEHAWDYIIKVTENNNTYTENCSKCFKSITTHEFFEE